MKFFKKLFTLAMAAVTAAVCLTTTAFAENVREYVPDSANRFNAQNSRSVSKLPDGTYYCLSTGREDAYIEIVNRGFYDTAPRAYFYKVYAGSGKGYVTGNGDYIFPSSTESITFQIKSWHTVGSSNNSTIQIDVTASYIDEDIVMFNGEIFVKR